jgi:D-alanyl-D-alanine dipeptidase
VEEVVVEGAVCCRTLKPKYEGNPHETLWKIGSRCNGADVDVDSPSGYDEMTDRAFAEYEGGSADERARRALLRQAMEKRSFTFYPQEWWHFDYKDWKQYPILNVKFEDLGQ